MIVLYADDDDESSEDGQQQAAEMLYGMIHARFLLTGQGLVAMVTFLLNTL